MKEGRPNVDDCRGSMMGKGGLLYYSLNFRASLKMSKIKRIFLLLFKEVYDQDEKNLQK